MDTRKAVATLDVRVRGGGAAALNEHRSAPSAAVLQSETTFCCSGAAMCIADASTRVVATNAAFDARVGPCRDRSIVSLFVDGQERARAAAQLRKILEDGSSTILRGVCATSDFRVVLRWSCRAVDQSILAVVEDRTDQTTAPGHLTGGVGHDFNNLLTVVLGQLQFLRRSSTLSEADRGHVDEAFDATGQAIALTRQLMSIGRGEEIQRKSAPLAAAPRAPAGGSERILVVEDEDGLRRLVVEILVRAGYRVLSAADGEEAVRALVADGVGPDLLLTDVVMPRMNGRTLAAYVATACPRARVVLMSGHDEPQERQSRPQGRGGSLPVLEKPFAEEALLRKIRDTLDAE